MGSSGHLQALLAHRGLQRLERAVGEHVDARAALDRAGERLALPRLVEQVRADGLRDAAHEPLGALGDDLPVGVGLVPLEHRELGVVLGREALVAEVLADLVHALEPADDQPLEVELGRDPQVHRAVERVEVRHERARERAAVERLEHRRLDLDEALVVEEAADRGDDLRARDEDVARLLVGHQVELAVAQARLGVREPVVLLGRRSQRLREQRPVVDRDAQLAAAGLEDRAVGAEQVAEVAVEEPLERLVAEHVAARLELDPARAVVEVEERHLALAAAGVQAAGDAHADVGLLAGFESLVRSLGVGDRRDVRVGVRERVDPRLPQCLELAAADGEQIAGLRVHATSILVTVSSRCLPLGSITVTASPFLRPTSALPTGDSLESRLADGSASVEPTIVYVSDFPARRP